MKLTVKCFATLMPLTPPGGSLEFHGTDICDLLRQLSIPESEARIIFERHRRGKGCLAP